MRLTVLVDNNTFIDEYYYGEPGVSYYIEDEGIKILFDTGYSDIFIKNAVKMGIELENTDYTVLSHGHNDHTWGLEYLLETVKSSSADSKNKSSTLLAHPLALCPKMINNEQIGITVPETELKKKFNLTLSSGPVWISERMVFLGQIERTNDFENQEPIGETSVNGAWEDDYLLDDSALVYKTKDGLVIITGCSHAGICNIIEYAKKICREDRVLDIIGGLHLLNPSVKQLENTLEYLKKLKPKGMHACHCTDLRSKIALSQVVRLEEVGVGLTLNFGGRKI